MNAKQLLGNSQIAAIQAEPMPCNGCKHISLCSVKRLSCADMNHYYETGKVRNAHRNPSKQQFILQARS